MARRIIQVPMEEDLLAALDARSRDQQRPRAAVIREACRTYLTMLEEDQRDRVYQEGYRRLPEAPTLAEAQVALIGQVLAEETW